MAKYKSVSEAKYKVGLQVLATKDRAGENVRVGGRLRKLISGREKFDSM